MSKGRYEPRISYTDRSTYDSTLETPGSATRRGRAAKLECAAIRLQLPRVAPAERRPAASTPVVSEYSEDLARLESDIFLIATSLSTRPTSTPATLVPYPNGSFKTSRRSMCLTFRSQSKFRSCRNRRQPH